MLGQRAAGSTESPRSMTFQIHGWHLGIHLRNSDPRAGPILANRHGAICRAAKHHRSLAVPLLEVRDV
jgi:hypothetical protein